MARRVVVRIIGLSATALGFGYAVTEGPERLVKWGAKRTGVSKRAMNNSLVPVLHQYKPLFVALERREGARGKRAEFIAAVREVATAKGVMVLEVGDVRAFFGVPEATRWETAKAVADTFPKVARFLPKRRKPWQAEPERVGLFMALGAAVSAWHGFRGKRR